MRRALPLSLLAALLALAVGLALQALEGAGSTSAAPGGPRPPRSSGPAAELHELPADALAARAPAEDVAPGDGAAAPARTATLVGTVLGDFQSVQVVLEVTEAPRSSVRTGPPTPGSGAWTARADVRGAFRIGGLPAHYELRAELFVDGLRIVPREPWLVFEPGETRRVTWELEVDAVLAGRVVDVDGRPLPDVRLEVAPTHPEAGPWSSDFRGNVRPRTAYARTDAEGRFTFRHLEPDRWTLRAAVGEPHALAASEVDVPPPPDGAWVVLVAQPGRTIEGTVHAPDGDPLYVVGRVVARDPVTGREVAGDTSVSDGRFRIAGLASGAWELVLEPHDGGKYEHPFAPSAPLLVEAGATGVELVAREAASLGVALPGVERAGGPVRVWIAGPGRFWLDGWSPWGDDTAAVHGLPPGTYRVACTAPGGAFVLTGLHLAEGEARAGVPVQLAPAAEVWASIEGPGGPYVLELCDGPTVLLRERLRGGVPPLAPLVVPLSVDRAVLRRFDEVAAEASLDLVAGDRTDLVLWVE